MSQLAVCHGDLTVAPNTTLRCNSVPACDPSQGPCEWEIVDFSDLTIETIWAMPETADLTTAFETGVYTVVLGYLVAWAFSVVISFASKD